MLYKLKQEGKPTEYVIMPDGGPMINLGDRDQAEFIAGSLLNSIFYPRSFPLPDLPELPADEPFYTLPEAVTAAFDRGYIDIRYNATDNVISAVARERRRLTDSIRSAARAGRIAGAYRTPEGYWRLPVAAFNAWIAEHAEQRRGRPRKEAAVDVDSLDAYTFELWRNRQTGEQYAIKRDSTGIVVGAIGPFLPGAGDVQIGAVDWSLDLAHTLQADRLLGGYERIAEGA
jgi:hypothetical protein